MQSNLVYAPKGRKLREIGNDGSEFNPHVLGMGIHQALESFPDEVRSRIKHNLETEYELRDYEYPELILLCKSR